MRLRLEGICSSSLRHYHYHACVPKNFTKATSLYTGCLLATCCQIAL